MNNFTISHSKVTSCPEPYFFCFNSWWQINYFILKLHSYFLQSFCILLHVGLNIFLSIVKCCTLVHKNLMSMQYIISNEISVLLCKVFLKLLVFSSIIFQFHLQPVFHFINIHIESTSRIFSLITQIKHFTFLLWSQLLLDYSLALIARLYWIFPMCHMTLNCHPCLSHLKSL